MNIVLTPQTYDRLINFARPLEDADAVISRLMQNAPAQERIPFSIEMTPLTPTVSRARTFNTDVLSRYLRPAYVGVTYSLACYDLLSGYTHPKGIPWIADKLFKFPDDSHRAGRMTRAIASLKICLKEYKRKPGEVRLFKEPKTWHFQVAFTSLAAAPGSESHE